MQIIKADPFDVQSICKLIDSYDLPPEIFIKNSQELVQAIIEDGCSYCIYLQNKRGLKLVGALLVTKENYIDTIVSIEHNAGSMLLKILPAGLYTAHTSELNEKSKALFTSFGFKAIRKEILEGQDRVLYEGTL
jgi:hypothetical protein